MLKNKKIATVVAAVALAVGVSGAAYSYTAPQQYVSFDINPSVELTTNMFDKVIAVNPLNEDGIKILETLKLENKDVKDAVDMLTQAAIANGYLAEELQNEILVTVSSDNEEEATETETELGEVINEELTEENLEETPVTTQNINLERHKEAARLGISPGKMNLIQKLQAVNPEINVEEYAKKPVKDIMKEIKSIRKENKDAIDAIEELDQEEATEGTVVEEATEAQDDATIVEDADEDNDDADDESKIAKEKKEKEVKEKKEKSNNGNQGNGNNGNGNGNNGNNGNGKKTN
ncbi:hypothetical protein [Clostridium sp.]|uniref:anti-sigma-I factor RsgI family protein n=1 Tax=Clostridium sp. TaxID=1506 RepID=UPI002FC68F53